MKRSAHHPSFDQNGMCRRCGCNQYERRCPPGFWMTQAEAGRWLRLNVRDREDMEIRLATKLERARNKSSTEKGSLE